jgi:dTDP-4-amino-4,6-dideoxygalactose transaminase/nucleoside-diphosphate-sugar epimerase
MTNQSVLVTGGAGYVGSVLVRRLLETGRRVTVLDTMYFGLEPLNDLLHQPRLRIVRGDTRTFGPELLEGVDAVIHLAALSNDPSCELRPAWSFEVNRDATARVARMAKEAGIKTFVFASSCSVYGMSDCEICHEDAEPRPASVYAQAKVEAEEQLFELMDDRFRPICIRPATIFGLSRRMRFDLVVNVMTLNAVKTGRLIVTGGGEQWRPLVHVQDMAEAYLRCLEVGPDELGGRAFNVVGGNYRVREIAAIVRHGVGDVEVSRAPGTNDPRSYRVCGAAFEQATGWRPTRTIENGVTEIAAAIQAGEFPDTQDTRYYTVKRLKEVADLPALEGGEPVRSAFLPFAQCQLGAAEEAEIIDSMRSGWITTGPKVQKFEQMMAEYIGCKHAIAVSSCTAALHLSLAALDLGPGDEVITTPITWPATSNVIVHLGARPVFVDVEPDTLNIDPTGIEAKITPRTRAIVPVHMAGQPCDMDAIHAIAGKHGLAVVEDAAHAIGASYKGRKIGTLSQFTCFSFYPTKNMTTIEGGLIATDDDTAADKMRALAMAGINRDAWKRYSKAGSLHWELIYPGYKYNMTDIQAAVGIHQLPRLDRFNARREQIVRRYHEALAGVPGLSLLADLPERVHARHLCIAYVEADDFGTDRDGFIRALKAENVGTGVHFISLHLQPWYRDAFDLKRADLPNAALVSDRLVSLPLYPKMTNQDVEDAIAAIKKVAAHYRARCATRLDTMVAGDAGLGQAAPPEELLLPPPAASPALPQAA